VEIFTRTSSKTARTPSTMRSAVHRASIRSAGPPPPMCGGLGRERGQGGTASAKPFGGVSRARKPVFPVLDDIRGAPSTGVATMGLPAPCSRCAM